MEGSVYTLGVWRVKPGRDADFVAAWKALGEVFLALEHPPGPGTLLQSATDPALYYSFGGWAREADIQAMREDPGARAALQRLVELCTDATPGMYRVVARVPDRPPPPRARTAAGGR